MEKGGLILRKKIVFTLFLIIILINITGCNKIDKTINSEKPNNYYYTNGLITAYKNEGPKTITIFHSELYKERALDKSTYNDVESFLNDLKSDLFIEKPSNLPKVPLYKLNLEFNKIKYVINVYNEKYASIYPWDGKFDMDFIDMTTIPLSHNLYGICRYYLPD